MPRIALLGDINVDLTLAVDRLPPRGGEAVGRELVPSLGGSATGTACWLAACGAEVRLAACVGEDPWGDWALGELKRRGVPTQWIQRVSTSTGVFLLVIEPDGERTMFGARGANAHLRWEGIGEGWLAGVDWLHLSGYAFLEGPQEEAAWTALREAAAREIPVSLDPGWCATEFAKEALVSACAEATLFLPNLEEAKRLVGEGPPEVLLERLSELVPGGEVILKLGPGGCLVRAGGEAVKVPAPEVGVTDTTGAGDAFAAGAILGWLAGWEPRLRALLGVLLGTLAASMPQGAGFPPPVGAALSLVERLEAGEDERRALRRFVQLHWREKTDGR
ncbi:carbohydrate kinase family protein [Candidatus Bipolaricaulota sp. J31]